MATVRRQARFREWEVPPAGSTVSSATRGPGKYTLVWDGKDNAGKPVKAGSYTPDTTAAPFESLRAYKGRSLNGIWATAPYLHNGSVPTLYDLLLPADQRPKKFMVGSRKLDPDKVGFEHDLDKYNGFLFDTSLPTNSNAGHEYGTGLTDPERKDLVAYLKTL